MSTSTSQGYDVSKPTSKVLAPPGGASSFSIIGGYEPEPEKKPVKTGPISSVFGAAGDEDAQQQANKNKAKAQESSQFVHGGAEYDRFEMTQDRLFGGPDNDAKASGKGKDGEKDKDEEEEEKNGDVESDKKKDESQTQATPSPRQKGRASSNPLTHEGYANESPKAAEPAAQKPKRQPPGGFSQGIW